jgi:hypothetical protein
VAADALIVDIAPEIAVVLSVGDRDFFVWVFHGASGQIQLTGVDIEQLDVVDYPLDVIDDATHRRAVAVSRLQRRRAPPQATDEVVKFGEFSSAGQRTSLG